MAKYSQASPLYEPVPLAWLAVSSHPHSLFSPSTTDMAGGEEKQALELQPNISQKSFEADDFLSSLFLLVE